MASTWSALKIELLETGQNSGTWGTATNVNLGDAILGEAITGQATVDFATDADVTITLTDSATSQSARNLRLNITESSTGVGSVRNLILGSGCQIEKFYLINNTGTGAKTVKNTSGTGISVPAGKATLVYNNGTNVVDAASYFSSLTLGSALPVASGGTGQTTAAAAITALTGTQVSGQYLRSNGTNAVLAAIQSGDVPTLNQNTTGTAAGLSSTLVVTSGGTGQTSYTDGQLLIGNSTGNTLTKATLTAGSNITITNSAGGITIASTGGGTPGGSTTQVQYNNAGSFAGSSNMTFDGTRLTTAAITSSGVTNSFGSATNANVANLFSGTKTGYAMLAVDSSTLSPVATSDAGLIFIQPAVGNTIQKASTGTHANFASLYVPPFAVGAGASTLTNASSIYVPSAPSGATNNYAISVGSGTTYLNGLVDISGASAGQIKFPATQNASADANTLDDYEEGTWTATLSASGGTFTVQGRDTRYTKIGRAVAISGYVQINCTAGSGANAVSLTGLPFTTASGSNFIQTLPIGFANFFANASGFPMLASFNSASSTTVLLRRYTNDAGTTKVADINSQDITNANFSFMLNGTYFV